MKYHVSGEVVAIEATDRIGGAHDGLGLYAILTIRDRLGREWRCPWGIDPDLPNLGDTLSLGCEVRS